MDVSQLNANSTNQRTALATDVSGDFETFLRMMTTQIQNQDPLSPMEADQFASQLAAFSMVEQQTLTNQRLEAILSGLTTNRLAGYSDLVGRVAVHQGAFEFSGSSIDLEIEDGSAPNDSAKIVILNASGAVAGEIGVAPGQTRITWSGQGLDGQVVEPGQYSAIVRRVSDDAVLDIPVSTAGTVEEVRFGNGEAELLLADGTVVSESSVSKLR